MTNGLRNHPSNRKHLMPGCLVALCVLTIVVVVLGAIGEALTR